MPLFFICTWTILVCYICCNLAKIEMIWTDVPCWYCTCNLQIHSSFNLLNHFSILFLQYFIFCFIILCIVSVCVGSCQVHAHISFFKSNFLVAFWEWSNENYRGTIRVNIIMNRLQFVSFTNDQVEMLIYILLTLCTVLSCLQFWL